MLRHHNITHHREPISAGHVLQRPEKQIPPSGAPQKRSPLITTGRDEMQILRPVESFETCGHVAIVGLWFTRNDVTDDPRTHPCKERKDGATSSLVVQS
jgi:hypothetical protein